MQLPWYLSSFSSLSISFRDEITAEFNKVCFTYLSVPMYSNSAPQKVRPSPTKVRREDAKIIEIARAIKPNVNRIQLTFLAGLVF